MKRWVHASEEVLDQYTDEDLISAINKAAKTNKPSDIAIAQEMMYEILEKGDQVFVEESDGRVYPYTLISKSNYYNNFRLEFEAQLSRDLAYETDGYVRTCTLIGQLIYGIQHGRTWYLNLKR